MHPRPIPHCKPESFTSNAQPLFSHFQGLLATQNEPCCIRQSHVTKRLSAQNPQPISPSLICVYRHQQPCPTDSLFKIDKSFAAAVLYGVQSLPKRFGRRVRKSCFPLFSSKFCRFSAFSELDMLNSQQNKKHLHCKHFLCRNGLQLRCSPIRTARNRSPYQVR